MFLIQNFQLYKLIAITFLTSDVFVNSEIIGCKDLIQEHKDDPSLEGDAIERKDLFICELRESAKGKEKNCRDAVEDFKLEDDNSEGRSRAFAACGNPQVISKITGPPGPLFYGRRRGPYGRLNHRPRYGGYRRAFKPSQIYGW